MAGETAARIGSNFSDYTGNAVLGGTTGQVIGIDTKPLENLAQYTFLYNRSLWDQKQKDTDAKIKELADLSNIALNDLRDKDKEQATKEFADLQKYAAEYLRKIPSTPEEKIQNELDWQVKYGAFKNNYKSGKTRAVSYYKRYNDIMAGTEDAKSKDAQVAILNKEFSDTDISTPISGTQAFKTQKFDVPEPTAQKFQSVVIGGNENLAIDGSVYNPKLNAGVADVAIIGLKKIYPQKGTPEYEKLSQGEKNQAEVQSTVESGAKGWVDATEPLNQALKGYIDADGNFDAKKFEDENASNITLMNAYNALKRYDSYNRDKYTQAKSGVFNDKGLSVKLPPNLNPEDFKAGFVDFSKGVNANQLVQSGMFAKYQGDLFAKKVTETDDSLQYAQLAETIRNNKADQYLRGKELEVQANRWKASTTGGETQINGAMVRAKRIYADMLKLADKNGVISPDKIRQLNVEQLRYLGVETPQQRDDAGTIISAGGLNPLKFDKEKEYAIQLVNGEIRVLTPKEGENIITKRPSGSYEGLFDPTKSTNIFNVGTNIINEELKNAGAKELNAYMGNDVTGGITQSISGGSQTVSGSQSRKGQDGKTYTSTDGITWTAPDGTTVVLKKK